MSNKKNLLLQITDDGSSTLFNEMMGENYHSHFGAVGESMHIFIEAGLKYFYKRAAKNEVLNILEVGFGTGLNALLTYIYNKEKGIKTNYKSYEPYPVSHSQVMLLNYCDLLGVDKDLLWSLHSGDINRSDKKFFIEISNNLFEKATLKSDTFDIVYFDAFSPDAQSELWTPDVMKKVYNAMKNCSVLTTYSCKGDVKRALKGAGFKIEKLPGPPGKREFLRAVKEEL